MTPTVHTFLLIDEAKAFIDSVKDHAKTILILTQGKQEIEVVVYETQNNHNKVWTMDEVG